MSHLSLLSDLLIQARKTGATAADAVMIGSTELSLARRMRQPEGLERAESSGLGLRVWVGDSQAIVSTSDTGREHLNALVERAVAMAKASPPDPFATLAPEALLARAAPALDLYDGEEPSPEWLLEQCSRTEEEALSVPGISNSQGAQAQYRQSRIALATSGGFAQEYQTSSASLSVTVLAGDGVNMERDYDYATARYKADLPTPETIGRSAAERTLARLNPRKVATCQVPVVWGPRVAKNLLASFAGAINGSAIARGTSFLKDKMGSAIFNPAITILDDPHRPRGLASRPFDGEGVANARRTLVQDGILQSWLLDMRSANKLGLTTTGHASRGMSSPPSPSSTNLYIEAGTLSPEALIRDIRSGFYVTDVFGMGVNLITGDYSQGASGRWIENGKLAYAVSELTIAGHLSDMFAQMTPANDLEFRYGTNAPTLRVEKMTVAGS